MGSLRGLAIMHASLEARLDACEDLRVRQAWPEDLRRLPELLRDNGVFRPKRIADAPGAVEAALRAA